MNALIIDDQEALRKSLGELLRRFCPDIRNISEAESVSTGLEALGQGQPDILFLDVELGDGTGMDLLRQLDSHDFQLVFVTAHDRFALEAFRFSALDFILKPVDPEDLINAVHKARESRDQQNLAARLELLESHLQDGKAEDKKIALKDSQRIVLVRISEILRCMSEGSYTHFYLQSGKHYVVSGNLKEYESMLAAHGFHRVHHSHLVNLAYVRQLEKSLAPELIMEDGSKVPVSSRKRKEVLGLLENI